MIKGVIFDYFGVIYSNNSWRDTAPDRRLPSGKKFGVLAQKVNKGEIHWSEFIDSVARLTNQNPRDLEQKYESEGVNKEVIAWVKELKDTGLKVGLLTNANHEFLDPIIDRLHLSHLFDAIVISSRYGIIKPNPQIYLKALEKLNLKPQEAVMIDDLPQNVAAAKNLGIRAVQFKSTQQARKDLERILNNG